jgi:hypothetical protein
MHSGAALDFAATLDMYRKALPPAMHGTIDEGLDAASAELQMDVEKVLLPALGPELAFGVVLERADPSGQQPAQPPIPGVALLLGTRNQEVVRKAVDRGLAAAQQAYDESQGGRRRKQELFKRVTYGDQEMTRLEMQGEMPFRPALAYLGDALVVALDEDTIKEMVDVRAGKAKPLSDAPATRRLVADLPSGDSWAFLDWNRFLDQVSEYETALGPLLADDDAAETPELPQGGGREAMKEWQRKMQEAQAAKAKSGGAKLRRWIDAARLVDCVGTTSRWTKEGQEGAFVVRFDTTEAQSSAASGK